MPAGLIADALPAYSPPPRLFAEAANEPELMKLAAQLLEMFDELPRVPARLREGWERLCRAATEGRLNDLHAGRDEYAAVYRGYIADAERAYELARAMGSPRAGQLRQTLSELRGLYEEIFAGWKTIDDLAAVLAARVPLSEERLKALAAAYPPPRSWYDEDFDPFTPDPTG